MNSESSTRSGRKRRTPAGGGQTALRGKAPRAAAAAVGPECPFDSAQGRQPGARSTGGFQPVHLLILGTTTAATAGALLARSTEVANIVFVVLTIVAAGVGAGAVYRTLSPLTSEVATGEPEMVGGRTRAALEREKTIVLRAIKELEFDRAMGKVSEADCEEMIGRLRARAVRLIRQLDAGSAGYRELIERELNARLPHFHAHDD